MAIFAAVERGSDVRGRPGGEWYMLYATRLRDTTQIYKRLYFDGVCLCMCVAVIWGSQKAFCYFSLCACVFVVSAGHCRLRCRPKRIQIDLATGLVGSAAISQLSCRTRPSRAKPEGRGPA